MDWHLIFVVDVSGSMEASVIYSALVAGIFSALPAIDVRFFAFSTEVIDLSDSVDDPLALLMEVKVGGGTHIGLGLRAAREAIRNPIRTMVVLVTDFEEGMSVPEMLAEIRMLARLRCEAARSRRAGRRRQAALPHRQCGERRLLWHAGRCREPRTPGPVGG